MVIVSYMALNTLMVRYCRDTISAVIESGMAGQDKGSKMFKRIPDRVRGWLNAPRFFYLIVGILVVQALWIALTARYPQAFDENFHFGLIRLHADKLLPFFTAQPPNAEVYGAVWRDPSYLYHYLMSFPYRLLALVTDSQAVQVIVLRLVNIGFFVWGLYVFRRLLLKLGASQPMMHVVLLFFVLTPIMPLLAAHINYDNVIFPLTGLLFLSLITLIAKITAGKAVPIQDLLAFALIGAVASLIKYTFTPILLASVVALVWVVIWNRISRKNTGWIKIEFQKNLQTYGMIAALIVFGWLFTERYGLNSVYYGTPVPDCAQVLTVEECIQYSPWGRDYRLNLKNDRPDTGDVLTYPYVWVRKMMWETMFTISSWFDDTGIVRYHAANPLPIAYGTAWIVTVVGLLLGIVFARRLWGMTYLRVLLLIIGFYIAVLFMKNVSMYLHSSVPVAIHGRYLIPVFPVLYLAIALGYSWLIDRTKRPDLKAWMVVAILLLFLQGGGISVWLVRSDDRWFWQQSAITQQINGWARSTLSSVTLKDIGWVDIKEPKI